MYCVISFPYAGNVLIIYCKINALFKFNTPPPPLLGRFWHRLTLRKTKYNYVMKQELWYNYIYYIFNVTIWDKIFQTIFQWTMSLNIFMHSTFLLQSFINQRRPRLKFKVTEFYDSWPRPKDRTKITGPKCGHNYSYSSYTIYVWQLTFLKLQNIK